MKRDFILVIIFKAILWFLVISKPNRIAVFSVIQLISVPLSRVAFTLLILVFLRIVTTIFGIDEWKVAG